MDFKHLEDDRAARRERARARVADGWAPPAPVKPAKPKRERTLTPKQVDRAVYAHRKEIELMLDDAARDTGLDPETFFVDIVRSYEASAAWEAPIVRAEVLRSFGLEVR